MLFSASGSSSGESGVPHGGAATSAGDSSPALAPGPSVTGIASWIGESGMTSATAGLCSRDVTVVGDTVAATELTRPLGDTAAAPAA
jgi:hypothetical protein